MARLLLDATNPAGANPEPQTTTAAASDASGMNQHSWHAEARRHWGAALPDLVPLAFAHASEADLRGVGDENLAEEALAVRELMLDSSEVRFSLYAALLLPFHL